MRTALLVAVLATLPAGALAAQDRPPRRELGERRDTLARDTIPQDTARRDTVRPPPPTLGYEPAAFALELALGLPGSGTAQRQPVEVTRTDPSGTVTDSAALIRTLDVRGGVFGGVSGILGLGKDWALRLGAGVATATVEAAYGGGAVEDDDLEEAANAIPGTRADLRLLTLETGLRYRIPSSKRLQPYVELGAAVSDWSVEGTVPPGLRDDFGTRFEATAGVGGVIPLSRRFSARIHASTRVFGTPIGTRPPGDTLGTRTTLGWPPNRKDAEQTTVLVSRPPNRSLFADGAREILTLLRFQVGLSWDLGRPPLTLPEIPAPAPDTTSPPGR